MRLLFWIILLFNSFVLFAQTEICGSIKNTANESIMGVTVLVKHPENEKTLAYAITKADGSYCIQIADSPSVVTLEFRSMGYVPKALSIENKNHNLNNILQESKTELEEVVVKALPITQRGDTLNYSVGSFTREHDRSIGDVLSRMPGFDVLEDGKILYQGKAINKYYINNMDLLEGRYNLANKNLPHKEVLRVQVMENHQPIKVLDSIVLSDRAAINIELKNPITMTGQAVIGAGATPLLWDVNLSPMLFNPKKQVLISYQANNTGDDVASQLKVLTIEDLLNGVIEEPGKSNWLGIKNIQTGPIDKKRALNNNVHMISANYLQRLKKDVDLRIKTSYVNDYQKPEGSISSRYFVMGDTTAVFEQINNKLHYNSLQTEVNVERNSDNSYLKNALEFQGAWDAKNGSLQLDNRSMHQGLKHDYTVLTNNFKAIVPIANNLLTIHSNLHLDEQPETLRVEPRVFNDLLNNSESYEETLQDLQLQTFFTNNFIRFTKKWKGLSLSPRIGLLMDRQHLQTELFGAESPLVTSDYKNDLKWNKTDVYADLSSDFKYKKWTLRLQAPFHWYHYQLKNRISLEDNNLKQFVFTPLFNVRYDLNSKWRWIGSVSKNKNYGTINQLYGAYILTNYQNIQRNDAAIPETTSNSFATVINYKNIMQSIFWNASYSRAKSTNNLMFVTDIKENGAKQVETILQNNDSYQQSIKSDFTKYFYEIRSNFKLDLAYSTSKFHQVLNQEMTEIQMETLNLGGKADVEVNDWFNLTYSYDWMKSYSQLQDVKNAAITRQDHKVQLHIYPTETQYIGWESSYVADNLFSSSSHSFFSDLVYRYTIKQKNIDLELNWQNIFDTRNYRSINVSDYSYIESNIILRPSQVLFKVRFSF